MEEQLYRQQALAEAEQFIRQLERKSSLFQRTSKKVQTKINSKVPEKVHRIITGSIRMMIQTALGSSEYIYPQDVDSRWTLEERERRIRERIQTYKRTAMIEGAGTGAGGVMLGLADFPLLLSIKMKFLFEVGQYYGFNVKQPDERVFLLHVFLLTFSSDKQRKQVLRELLNWDKREKAAVDWQVLQQEYRDAIDLIKMFQLVPGFGAVVGAWANRKFLEELGETAMHIYRLRLLR